jgi:hypothetical protein
VCYAVYLSTDSPQDLAQHNIDLIHFEHESIPESVGSMLLYPHQWYVGSKSGCSCTFRHLYSVELGFGKLVAWYQEDEHEIAATLLFVKVVRALVERGHKVDCVDAWHGASMDDIHHRQVNLNELKDEQFRFFENHHFHFEMGS